MDVGNKREPEAPRLRGLRPFMSLLTPATDVYGIVTLSESYQLDVEPRCAVRVVEASAPNGSDSEA